MKKRVKIKRWVTRNRIIILLVVVLLVFPLVIGLLYSLPIPQIISVDSGDLLAYYGTSFGILGSFIIYRCEKNKAKKEHLIKLRPIFSVEVSRDENEQDLFLVEITKHSDQLLSYLYLYDKFISQISGNKFSFRVTYNQHAENAKRIAPDYNITVEKDILDSDGYPIYVQILCDDNEGNMWNCCYHKVRDGESIYYYPREIELV